MEMTTELVTHVAAEPGMFDRDYRLFRVDGLDSRWYYCPEDGRYYPSVTSVIGATTPTPFGLMEWIKRLGPDADRTRDERAAYGTFMHQAIESLLTARDGFDLGPLAMNARMAAVHGNGDPDQWARDIQKDILAFEQFRRDYNVKPLAIELCLKHEIGGFGYAGAIDLIAEMDYDVMVQKGVFKSGQKEGEPRFVKERRRGVCIVDFKSGRHGFYESHEIQLHMYLDAASVFVPIARAFNWSPKDWRTGPSYNLKDQTESSQAAKVPLLLKLFHMDRTEPGKRLVIQGSITPGTPIESLYSMKEVAEIINDSTSK